MTAALLILCTNPALAAAVRRSSQRELEVYDKPEAQAALGEQKWAGPETWPSQENISLFFLILYEFNL